MYKQNLNTKLDTGDSDDKKLLETWKSFEKQTNSSKMCRSSSRQWLDTRLDSPYDPFCSWAAPLPSWLSTLVGDLNVFFE